MVGVAAGRGLALGGAGLGRAPVDEAHALRLVDVHDEGSDPYVLVRYGGPPARPTKGGRPRRVPLFGPALEALRLWRPVLATLPNPHGLLFPGRGGAFRSVGRPIGRAWETCVEKLAGRAVRWHDLRHTCASSLVAGWWGASWSLEEVCALLGHSSVKVTERYAHFADDALTRAARRMGPADAGSGVDAGALGAGRAVAVGAMASVVGPSRLPDEAGRARGVGLPPASGRGERKRNAMARARSLDERRGEGNRQGRSEAMNTTITVDAGAAAVGEGAASNDARHLSSAVEQRFRNTETGPASEGEDDGPAPVAPVGAPGCATVNPGAPFARFRGYRCCALAGHAGSHVIAEAGRAVAWWNEAGGAGTLYAAGPSAAPEGWRGLAVQLERERDEARAERDAARGHEAALRAGWKQQEARAHRAEADYREAVAVVDELRHARKVEAARADRAEALLRSFEATAARFQRERDDALRALAVERGADAVTVTHDRALFAKGDRVFVPSVRGDAGEVAQVRRAMLSVRWPDGLAADVMPEDCAPALQPSDRAEVEARAASRGEVYDDDDDDDDDAPPPAPPPSSPVRGARAYLGGQADRVLEILSAMAEADPRRADVVRAALARAWADGAAWSEGELVQRGEAWALEARAVLAALDGVMVKGRALLDAKGGGQ